jgi:predicted O-methyltransferase YrrM
LLWEVNVMLSIDEPGGSPRIRQIDNDIEYLFSSQDATLKISLKEMRLHGLPAINVSANEGRSLYLLARLMGARKVLEVGTLAGYSTIWLARALPPDGYLLTLESEAKPAEIARRNIARAGLADRVEVRLGAGLDLMAQLVTGGEGPFDLFFIDADKENYPGYLQLALRLSRSGSVILSDNLIRNGAVIQPEQANQEAQVRAQYNRELATNIGLESIIMPVINRDRMDGLGITIVK